MSHSVHHWGGPMLSVVPPMRSTMSKANPAASSTCLMSVVSVGLRETLDR
jgi:hypothetical protein